MKRILVLGLVMAGCAKPVSQMNYAEMNDLAGKIRARCTAQGAGPGTPRWNDCATIESNYEVQTRERQQAAQVALAQAAAGSAAGAFSGAAAAANANSVAFQQRPVQIYQPQTPFTCTSSTVGITTSTSCR